MSDLALNLILPTAAAQFDDWESMPLSSAPSASTLVANTMYFVRGRVGKPLPVGRINHFIGTASGNVADGVYLSDGTTLTLLTESGSVAAAGTNANQSVAMTATGIIPAGVTFYAFVQPDNATVTIGRITVNSENSGRGKRAASHAPGSFTRPATIALASLSASSTMVSLFLEA